MNQTYDFTKIFTVLLTTKNLEQLYLAIQRLGEKKFQIEFVDRNDFQSKLQQTEGTYVQFVLPGDKLFPNKIMNSVEFMHSDFRVPALFCGLDTPQDLALGALPNSFEYIFEFKKPVELLNSKELVCTIPGQGYLDGFLSNEMTLVSGLSRGFFHQGAFNRIDWINDWLILMDLDNFCLESSSMFFILNIGLVNDLRFLNETLVIRGARPWNEMDLQRHHQIHNLIAQICSNEKFI